MTAYILGSGDYQSQLGVVEDQRQDNHVLERGRLQEHPFLGLRLLLQESALLRQQELAQSRGERDEVHVDTAVIGPEAIQ